METTLIFLGTPNSVFFPSVCRSYPSPHRHEPASAISAGFGHKNCTAVRSLANSQGAVLWKAGAGVQRSSNSSMTSEIEVPDIKAEPAVGVAWQGMRGWEKGSQDF